MNGVITSRYCGLNEHGVPVAEEYRLYRKSSQRLIDAQAEALDRCAELLGGLIRSEGVAEDLCEEAREVRRLVRFVRS